MNTENSRTAQIQRLGIEVYAYHIRLEEARAALQALPGYFFLISALINALPEAHRGSDKVQLADDDYSLKVTEVYNAQAILDKLLGDSRILQEEFEDLHAAVMATLRS